MYVHMKVYKVSQTPEYQNDQRKKIKSVNSYPETEYSLYVLHLKYWGGYFLPAISTSSH